MAKLKTFTGLALSLGILGSAQATQINYSAEPIAGSDFRYHYTVTNDSLGLNIDEFTIYFDRNLYNNLVVEASPTDWDPLMVQPDLGIPSDGFFDTLALVAGIAPGDSLGGFTVSFSYLGQGTPGSQPFEILDANFTAVDSGVTALPPNNSNSVPEPHGLALLAAGMAGLWARCSTRKGRVDSASHAETV